MSATTNFAFLPTAFKDLAEASRKAESHVMGDPRVPQSVTSAAAVPRQDLEALEKQLEVQAKAVLKQQQEKDALDAELQRLRAQLAEAKAAAEAQPDTHDYSEAQTRHYLIDLELKRAGWLLDQKRDKEFEVTGMPTPTGKGYVDDVLWGDDGKPLGLVESKKTTVDARVGQQQAKLYADCLEARYGQRPVLFYTNGYEIWLWDDVAYPPRRVSGFYKKEELARRIVGMDRNAAKAAFAGFLDDRTLNAPQMRFVEMVIDQLTARGFMDPAALYEAPFNSIHAGGPDALFAGQPNIIDGLFQTLEKTLPKVHTA